MPFKEALKSIKSSGTLAPSSQWLTKRILNEINFDKAKLLVEFGGGSGVFTKKLLSKLAPDGRLIVFEVNPFFYKELLKINDDRITVLNISAEKLSDVLKTNNLEKIDYIVSGLPLSNMKLVTVNQVLNISYDNLRVGGVFLQFQYSLRFYRKLSTIFNNNIVLNFEFLNFPPAFVYTCIK